MSHRLVIDGNAVYEIDEDCIKEKNRKDKQKIGRKEENPEKGFDKRKGTTYNGNRRV